MNKHINISIAGISFKIEQQGYQLLDQYLDQLKKAYRSNPDAKEILSDIEARIAELILSKQSNDTVVSAMQIVEITKQLGKPEVEQGQAAQTEAETESYVLPKRLYRNPQGSKIAGVCAGLGTYFHKDPTIIRLLFILPLVVKLILSSTGVWVAWIHSSGLFTTIPVLSYIVLWVVTPLARTPRQKLEMEGKKITVGAIGDNLRKEAKVLAPHQQTRKSGKTYTTPSLFIVQLFAIFIRIAALVAVAVLALATGIVALVTLITVLNISSITALIDASPLVGITPAWYIIITLLAALLTLVLLCCFASRFILNRKISRRVMIALACVWVALCCYTAYTSVANSDNIKHIARATIEQYTDIFTQDNVSIQIVNDRVEIQTSSHDIPTATNNADTSSNSQNP